MYSVIKTINSSEAKISFSLHEHDWKVLAESSLWNQLDKYLEVCQSQSLPITSEEREAILKSFSTYGEKPDAGEDLIEVMEKQIKKEVQSGLVAAGEIAEKTRALAELITAKAQAKN